MDEPQKKVFRNIQRVADTIDDRLNSTKVKDNYGLCNRCKYFKVIERELDSIVDCQQMTWEVTKRIPISKLNKVRDCSQFQPIGSLDINAMWMMAKLIDIEEKSIGFDLNKEVKITDTKEEGIDFD